MDQTVKSSGSTIGAELSAIEEKYPRIAKALCELWGKNGCSPYLLSLVFDERGGRQGFPPDVGAELLMLQGLMEYKLEGDVWTQSDQRI